MKCFLRSLAVALLLASPVQASDTAKAKEFIDSIASQVLLINKEGANSLDVKKQKMEALFTDKVDLDFVAKFALGKHWRAATPAQQAAYVTAYKPFILKNYAGRLSRYSGQTYTLKNTRSEGSEAVVSMEIVDPDGQNVLVDYRLNEVAGTYRIVDITVEGVSLLTTQRSEFNSIVDQKGVDGLIDALKAQVARNG